MRKAVILVAFVSASCASSPWQSTENVPGGRLYVPRVYAPLLPGSIYPDKKTPVLAKGRPAIVLVCPPKRDCRENEILDHAAQRGFVVLVARRAGTAVANRTEVDPTRTGTLIISSASLKVEISPPATTTAHPSSPSKKILFAAFLSDAPPEPNDGTILKLYSPNKEGLLPSEAFRDAVEWLAGELGAR